MRWSRKNTPGCFQTVWLRKTAALCRRIRFFILLGHNIPDLLVAQPEPACLPGVYDTDVFGEVSRQPDGFIEI
jgi:hypothetical protein